MCTFDVTFHVEQNDFENHEKKALSERLDGTISKSFH